MEKLYLQNNHLAFNNLNAFQQGEFEGDGTPFQYLGNLRVLNLRNNSITTIFRDWYVNTYQLEQLDLSYNNISTLSYFSLQFVSNNIEVNLTHNLITEIDLKDMEPIVLSQPVPDSVAINVHVNDNPLTCNCVIFSFSRYLLNRMDQAVYRRIRFHADELRCAEPEQFRNVKVTELQPQDLLCKLDQPGTELKQCPENCSCFIRPYDRSVIVNCTGQGLTEIPPLPQPNSFGYNFIELHVEDNNITKLPTQNLTGYMQVAELYARNNAIADLLPENLPSSLHLLDVTQNRFVMMNRSVIEALNSSKQLANLQLSENKWRCDCDSLHFLNFVQQNQRKIGDIGQLVCEDGKHFSTITANDLCYEDMTALVIVSIVLSVLGLLIGLFTVLYFSYHMEIKIWLFTHNLCLWLVSEEELDKDKLYDAFISYSHEDEEFIADHLVPTLEKEPMSFKTCVHVRDFMPGEPISTQVGLRFFALSQAKHSNEIVFFV